MTSSLPNFPAAPAPANTASAPAARDADFGVASSPTTDDFADLMAENDAEAAAECFVTATATPSFTILAPPLLMVIAASGAESADVAVPELGATDEAAPVAGEISRDTMEQAASLLATILQSVLPEPPAPIATTAGENVRSESVPGGARTPCGLEPARSAGSTAQTTPDTSVALTAETPVAETAPYAFEAALAADGAVEVNATLPKEQGSTDKSGAPSGAFEIQAELALPGQAVIRLSASGSSADRLQGRANFAGKVSAENPAAHFTPEAAERNFLVAGEKALKTASVEAGIAVAKSDATMTTVPTEATRADSNPDTIPGAPAHGEFTVAWPAAARVSEPAVAPVEKNFAERAVATVTNLVDTQFTTSMQKSGSVQLRLKFGGEDLNVRVELRGGAVHTDFRTDSAELRAALNREWQSVASQSAESLRRFVEPVFSPSSSHGGDSSSSFARQQAAQQDLPQQRPSRGREEDTLTFTRRSLVGETFAPPAPAPRAPALVPTSLRLSVLA